MVDHRGFLRHDRQSATRRPVAVRLRDWREVDEPRPTSVIRAQARRCMDCGIPFCINGCPLGNLIPEWNDLVSSDDWRAASERLHATNNFPEFTGRLCPAPCEAACVVGIHAEAVTIKQIEVEIVDRAWGEGWIVPVVATRRTGRRVAVVGSGPAGLAAAQQLTRVGHDVEVFERSDRIGGLLRYGIPSFKMQKSHLDRRLEQMRAEGTRFRTDTTIGVDIDADELARRFDAVILACGSTVARDLDSSGRELEGIHQAMHYLPMANRAVAGDIDHSEISAAGLDVVIIGGGDTGADCLGTALRQGARSVRQLEIMPEAPRDRPHHTPWPTWPHIFRTSPAHEEGGEREFAVSTTAFLGDDRGRVRAVSVEQVERAQNADGIGFVPVPGTTREIPAQLVLLALGFAGAEPGPLIDQLGLALADDGRLDRDQQWSSSRPGVYVCGDMGRGQSLIVWAIAEGRACAAAVDAHLSGSRSLPAPVTPQSVPLR